jgi:hypothetical protein
MSEPLDERYFTWLYSQVGSVEITNPSKTYWGLLNLLFRKEFFWIVPNDDNRAEDGRALRDQFIQEEGIVSVDADWMQLGCSMFELLIGLSRRLSFEDGQTTSVWFWELMKNLRLDRYTDNRPIPHKKVEDVLDGVIWRTYAVDGSGGIFPLKHPNSPVTKLELWYQAQAYLIERYY